MKASDVKVGMVLWDKRRKLYNVAHQIIDDMVLMKYSDHPKARPVAFTRDLRTLSKREKGN